MTTTRGFTGRRRAKAEETPGVSSAMTAIEAAPPPVRLTADDGYQAQRSYSIASPPEVLRLALTVERLERGEVSPWLAGEARPGDRFELRGPMVEAVAEAVVALGHERQGMYTGSHSATSCFVSRAGMSNTQ